MPAFNAQRWLAESIHSILTQGFADFELIIIDDGSTDATGAILANVARHDDRVHVVRVDHLGIAGALNRGLELARAPMIARMDADDLAHEDRFDKQLAFLRRHPNVAAVGTWAHVINEEGRRIGQLQPETDPAQLHVRLQKQNPFVHASMMFSADLVRRLGGYRAALEGAEDYDLWLRISERAQLANLPEPLLRYRRSASLGMAEVNKRLLSARLARLSAARRRAPLPDFVDDLRAPVDLDALKAGQELATTAAFFGLLSRPPGAALTASDLSVIARENLDHAERRAAQHWLRAVLKAQPSWGVRSAALFWLLRLHPARALQLL